MTMAFMPSSDACTDFARDDASDRRAGCQRSHAAGETPGVDGRQSIDILGRIDGRHQRRPANPDASAMAAARECRARGIAIELLDQRQKAACVVSAGRIMLERRHVLRGSSCAPCCGHRPGSPDRYRPAQPQDPREAVIGFQPQPRPQPAHARRPLRPYRQSHARSCPLRIFYFEHDLVRKPASAFRDHAPKRFSSFLSSTEGSPSTAIFLIRDVWPVPTRTAELGTPNVLAIKRSTARLLRRLRQRAHARLQNGAPVGQRLNAVDGIAPTARGQAQSNLDARDDGRQGLSDKGRSDTGQKT